MQHIKSGVKYAEPENMVQYNVNNLRRHLFVLSK